MIDRGRIATSEEGFEMLELNPNIGLPSLEALSYRLELWSGSRIANIPTSLEAAHPVPLACEEIQRRIGSSIRH